MNYKGYLKTETWKSFRDRIITERQCCEHCGSTEGLQLHHLTYERLGNEADEDVLVLCADCHRLTATELFDEYLEEGPDGPGGPDNEFC